ncbi:GntR family transcriptional repressor for pyruvate dehydrogenase complex [Paenibacillus sp. V4I3]|uniref:FadR/GntR family transcriptional regulator n=1 Tax=unclassified Paenibacillus TaxID=185978 RepID=UPI002786A72A|nr:MULTISPECIES: FadR/GntR family transcriptional regulator [unclassified Paenibacillus]MDQ0878568.1 GntR family transcriptional repressor for pyruvate dehydrogenase complex [Paenibacillus sp. V4I3]MDQ0885574.1 GntR family transcriptional repressor for pyruvate dehydrogenase complex [Paenibacillus sp. V4I9]
MTFQQIRPQKGSEIVLQQIKMQIETGTYAPGSKLPTVVELAASFQVGRSTVREALSGLKAMGWVDIRHGGGTFVTNPLPIDSSSLFDQGQTLQEVQEVRRFIEAGCASLAANRRTEGNLTSLRQILSTMEATLENEEESEQADIRFHLEIAKASHNSLMIGMMESLTERLQQSMKASRRLWFFAERASAEKLLQEHRDIVDAIEIKDEQLAAEKMSQHIHKVDQVIQKLAKISTDTF